MRSGSGPVVEFSISRSHVEPLVVGSFGWARVECYKKQGAGIIITVYEMKNVLFAIPVPRKVMFPSGKQREPT